MESKDQIIQLGKLLAEEQRRNFDDGAAPDGLERYLTGWRKDANGALQYSPVQQTLELLAGYGVFDATTRRARVGIALEGLRALFRGQVVGDRGQGTGDGRAVSKSLKSPASSPKAPAKPPAPMTLDTPIDQLPGIGKVTAQSFKRLGVRTVLDMLYHFPHRYDDYSSQKQIANLEIGAVETVIATVTDVRTFGMKAGGQALEVLVSDDSGDLKAVFFRQPWLARQFSVGARIVLSGKVTLDAFKGQRQISAPEWEPFTDNELIHTGRLVPVHSLTKGLYERNARSIIKRVVDLAAPMVVDYLPENVRQRANLMPLPQALVQMHFPADKEQVERARRRLGFDEFLFIQLGVLQRKLLWQGERGYPLVFQEPIHEEFLGKLPFELTGTQVRALEEIFHDIRRPTPMARLLQGDVGSGKTAVTAATAMQAIANGYQAAIMAPTEILAEQHYKGLKELLTKIRVPRGETWSRRRRRSGPSGFRARSCHPEARAHTTSAAALRASRKFKLAPTH